jgi:hypothetical protein
MNAFPFPRHAALVACALAIAACATAETGETVGQERDAGSTCARPPCDDTRDTGGSTPCVPSCSPGYVCLEGACIQDCNPPCADGQRCSADRVCVDDEAPDAGPLDSGADVATDTSNDAAPEVAPDVAPDAEPDLTPDADAGSCLEFTAEPRNVRAPVDLILAVDTSGSMDQETDRVEERLNQLTRTIGGSDIRVVLVANNDACIPPPLSGSIGCPDIDGPQYRHVRNKVDSGEVFATVLASWSAFEDFLRPDEAALHILVVTDDNDDDSHETFRAQVEGSDGRTMIFHSLTAANLSGGDTGLVPCVGWGGVGAAPGTEYRALSDDTGGVKASICEDDWDGIFAALAAAIADRSVVPCEYVLPDPEPGLEIDTDLVNVRVTPRGGAPRVIPNLDDLGECDALGGWVWADATRSRIVLCDQVCGENVDAVDLEFGCETVKG